MNILHAMIEPPKVVDKKPVRCLDKYHKLMSIGHIPNAKVYPLIPYGTMESGLSLTAPSEDQFRQIARDIDLRVDDTFICYDANIVHAGARLAWILKAFGAKKVHVLNGTLEKWVKEKNEQSVGEYIPENQNVIRSAEAKESDYDFKLNPEILYNYE